MERSAQPHLMPRSFWRLGRLTRLASGLTLWRYLGIVLVAAGIGAGLGALFLRMAGSFGALDPAAAAERSGMVFLILGAAVLVAVHLVVERVSKDHETGWPMVIFARGFTRGSYVLWVFGNALAVGVAFHLAGTMAFLVVTGQWPLSSGSLRFLVYEGPLAVAAFLSLGLLVSVLSRNASRTLLCLLLLVVGPYLVHTLLAVSLLPDRVPSGVRLALLWHVPPFRVGGIATFHHALYSLAAASLSVWLATRVFVRYE